jgi:hypothetical protein
LKRTSQQQLVGLESALKHVWFCLFTCYYYFLAFNLKCAYRIIFSFPTIALDNQLKQIPFLKVSSGFPDFDFCPVPQNVNQPYYYLPSRRQPRRERSGGKKNIASGKIIELCPRSFVLPSLSLSLFLSFSRVVLFVSFSEYSLTVNDLNSSRGRILLSGKFGGQISDKRGQVFCQKVNLRSEQCLIDSV